MRFRTPRARIFGVGAAISHLAGKAAHLLLNLAAGTLRHADFDEMSRCLWGTYHDGEEEHAVSGFLPSERETYDRLVKAGDRVLVVGCGSGRDLLPFVEAGHEVVGVEPSPEPILLLRQILAKQGRSAQVIEGFIESVPLTGTFDVVVFSANSYSYVRESARRIAMLQELARHLNRGGQILIRYVLRSADRKSRAIVFARLTARLTRSDWSPEPNDVLWWEPGSPLSCEHWFTPDEIEHEAREAGLRVVSHWGPPEGTPTAVLAGDGPQRAGLSDSRPRRDCRGQQDPQPDSVDDGPSRHVRAFARMT
jgi:SAM-dependent methyltransferase